jgi:hypothetical protein
MLPSEFFSDNEIIFSRAHSTAAFSSTTAATDGSLCIADKRSLSDALMSLFKGLRGPKLVEIERWRGDFLVVRPFLGSATFLLPSLSFRVFSCGTITSIEIRGDAIAPKKQRYQRANSPNSARAGRRARQEDGEGQTVSLFFSFSFFFRHKTKQHRDPGTAN